MKNFKLFGIIMMLIMGMSFSSCKDDDDPESEGTSTESINKNLEGEWFCVERTATENGKTYSETWDYNNQTQYGSNGTEPLRLIIDKIDDNIYTISDCYFDENDWDIDDTERYSLNGNILAEDTYEDEYCIDSYKLYISELSKNKLVIVNDFSYSDKSSGEVESGTMKMLFQRNK